MWEGVRGILGKYLEWLFNFLGMDAEFLKKLSSAFKLALIELFPSPSKAQQGLGDNYGYGYGYGYIVELIR